MLLDEGRLEEDLLLLLPCRSSYLAGSVSFELLFQCGSLSVRTLLVDNICLLRRSLSFSVAMLWACLGPRLPTAWCGTCIVALGPRCRKHRSQFICAVPMPCAGKRIIAPWERLARFSDCFHRRRNKRGPKHALYMV